MLRSKIAEAPSGRAARRATLQRRGSGCSSSRPAPTTSPSTAWPDQQGRPTPAVSYDVNDGNIDGNDSGKQSQIEFLLRVEEWYAAQTASFIPAP